MTDNKITVAVVGCGPQGIEHLRHLTQESGVGKIIGVEIDPIRRKKVAEEFQIEVADAFDAVVKDPAVDAVVIASANHTHPPFATAAFAAGKDVLCEKPLGPTLAECRQVVEASRRYKRILHTHFELRRSVVPSRLKAIIDSGEIGELRSLNLLHYRGAFRPAWKADPAQSGGLSLMETCHAIDLFRCLSGASVQEVLSFAPPISIPYYGFADTEYLIMKMERGIICHLTSCHTRSADDKAGGFTEEEYGERRYGHQYEYNVLGSRGAIAYDPLRGTGLCIYHHIGNNENWHCRLARVEDLTHIPYTHQIHGSDIPTFIQAVMKKTDTHITPEDALRTHEICFAVERSRELGGQPIRPQDT